MPGYRSIKTGMMLMSSLVFILELQLTTLRLSKLAVPAALALNYKVSTVPKSSKNAKLCCINLFTNSRELDAFYILYIILFA